MTENLFWSKTTEDGQPGVSVYQHMINVGRVAQGLAEANPGLLKLFNLRLQEIGALAALHDIGKISPGFQMKCSAWLEKHRLQEIARRGWKGCMESDHGKVSHAAIQKFLLKQGLPRKPSSLVACVLGAHHGCLTLPNEGGYRLQKAICESSSNIDWEKERNDASSQIWDFFQADKSYIQLDRDSPACWWLAGLTSIADWIGSDEHFFPPEQEEKTSDVKDLAHERVFSIGLQNPYIRPGLSFYDLFGYQPYDMQRKVLSVITEPGVYVIEAPMGMGKTEAALGAAYQLLSAGKARGIYFALPTQATSNRIHIRMDDFIRRISPESPSTKLIHANSWLIESEAIPEPSIHEKNGRDWFSSAKRALVAPFGVGTIDQALLGVVAAKHFFVRHFALAGKVIILDEIHSYDTYTGTLVEKLIAALEQLGCTVIVLSATLTAHRKTQLLSLPYVCDIEESIPYPLITGKRQGTSITPVDTESPPTRKVYVDFIAENDALAKAVLLAKKGGSVLWICDTVDSAQDTFTRIKPLCDTGIKLGLLHSRFTFNRREELENEWMERLGKDSPTRCGCILVSTQIAEQSVDLDADLVISELAPTDMLLQRMGRLWRHKREWRPNSGPEFCIIEEAENLSSLKVFDTDRIKRTLGGKSYVYAPYVLLRTLDLWKTRFHQNDHFISIPDDIRSFLESTYAPMENEPPHWNELSIEWFGSGEAEITLASREVNLWSSSRDDQEGVQTRLNEKPTIPLLLCLKKDKNSFSFIDGSNSVVDNNSFCLSTARSINKNLINIPKYCFEDNAFKSNILSEYIHGNYVIGTVSAENHIEVAGLKNEYSLYYTNDLGLMIVKRLIKEKV